MVVNFGNLNGERGLSSPDFHRVRDNLELESERVKESALQYQTTTFTCYPFVIAPRSGCARSRRQNRRSMALPFSTHTHRHTPIKTVTPGTWGIRRKRNTREMINNMHNALVCLLASSSILVQFPCTYHPPGHPLPLGRTVTVQGMHWGRSGRFDSIYEFSCSRRRRRSSVVVCSLIFLIVCCCRILQSGSFIFHKMRTAGVFSMME